MTHIHTYKIQDTRGKFSNEEGILITCQDKDCKTAHYSPKTREFNRKEFIKRVTGDQ
jgi:hypothetical protein